jgi:hypothetical protein
VAKAVAEEIAERVPVQVPDAVLVPDAVSKRTGVVL